MSQLSGAVSASALHPAGVPSSSPAQPQGSVPAALQHAHPAKTTIWDVLGCIGRVVLGVATLGISEGIIALVKKVRCALEEETPPPRFQADGSPRPKEEKSELGPAARDCLETLKEAWKAGVSQQELRAGLEIARQEGKITDAELHILEAELTDKTAPSVEAPTPKGASAPESEAAKVRTSVLRAQQEGKPFLKLCADVKKAQRAGKLTFAEADEILGQLNDTLVKSIQKPPLTQAPKISTKAQLLDMLTHLPGNELPGTVQAGPMAKDFHGEDKQTYTYSGLLFRGDSRPPKSIQTAQGFTSKKPLNTPESLREAQGLGQSVGATGDYGVSTAKHLFGAVGYSSGYLYIIDSTKLDGGQAYDMEAVSVRNGYKSQDETGGEVNVTGVPLSGVIGWIKIPSGIDPGELSMLPDNGVPFLVSQLTEADVFMNPAYKA